MPLKVYYLDDEGALCETFFDNFSDEKIQIQTFTEPSLFIEVANKNPPDLVFIDYRLPGTTGDKVAQNLPPHIPKYLVTGDLLVKPDYKFIAILEKPTRHKLIETIFEHHLEQMQKAG